MAKKKTATIQSTAEDWDPSDLCECSVEHLIEAAIAEGVFAYDLETTGLSPRKNRIEGVAFYVPNEKHPDRKPIRAWFPFTDGTMDYTVDGEVRSLRTTLDQVETMTKLRKLWSLKNVIAVRANGIFDDAFLYCASGLDEPIVIDNIVADSMLADYVADERLQRYGLKPRVAEVFGHQMTTYGDASGGQASFGFANKKPLGVYSCDDTAWTYRLWKWAMEQIRRQDPPRQHDKGDWRSPLDPDGPLGFYSDLEKVYWQIEMRIQRILMEMEITGCFIDWQWLVKVQERLEKEKEEIIAEIKEKAGWVPNLRSPKQVSDFIYNPPEKGGLGVPTEGVAYNQELDQYETGDKAINHHKHKYPLVEKLLKYRSLGVLESSFCQKLIGIAQAEGRVYARFRQTGTVIGRLSSADPVNLMNQPRDKELIRKAFCAHLEDDWDPERLDLCLIDADYGQMELRMAAHLANEPNMVEVYLNTKGCANGDGGKPCERYLYHECKSCGACVLPAIKDGQNVCGKCQSPDILHQARCRHVDLHQRTSEDVKVKRNPLAKNMNFGLLYRMGAPKFCIYAGLFDDDGKPRIEYGEELITKWHEAYPGIAAWHEREIHDLLKNNYIAYSLTRRRRRLDVEYKKNDFRAGTQAIQFRVSGSCQDIIKLAMIKIYTARNEKVLKSGPAEAKLWSRFKFMIQVHDELVFECPKAIKEEARLLVKNSMEGAAVGLRVPFVADARTGRTWDDTH